MSFRESLSSSESSLQFTALEYVPGQYQPTNLEAPSSSSSELPLFSPSEDVLDIRRPYSPPPPSFVTVDHATEQRPAPRRVASSSASVTSPGPPPDFTRVLEYVPTRDTVNAGVASDIDDLPLPTYEEARVATEKITYSFSQLKFNSMILLPPANSPNSRPLYHIMISMNCFMPMSFITTVNRGGTEYGEHVGEFEMGIIDKSSTILIRNVEYRQTEVMTRTASRNLERWVWFPRDRRHTLIWEYTTNTKQCHLPMDKPGRKTILATFHRAPLLTRKGNGPVLLPQLEVEPDGQHMFDDILMSLLVIERRKLTPKTSLTDSLFN